MHALIVPHESEYALLRDVTRVIVDDEQIRTLYPGGGGGRPRLHNRQR